MRFAMVATFYPPYSFGGDATYIRALAHGLADRGHEVEVMHCQDAFEIGHKGPTPKDPQSHPGVKVHRLHSRFGPLSPLLTQQTGRPMLKAPALRRFLGEGGFDVVNFHNVSLVGGPGVFAYSRAPVTLYTLHEHWLVCPTHIFWKNREKACDGRTCISCSLRSGVPPQLWRYTGLIEQGLAHVDRLLSPSAYTAGRHREYGITRPIDVLPLFSVFGDDEAPPAWKQPDRPRFLYAGRVTASKGIEPLLRAFAALPQYDLQIVGDGDQREALIGAYGACGNIRFLGHMPQAELKGLYQSANALILPSIAPETFGLTVVEAASCGTPAIVRAGAGGSPEIVETSGGGFVYGSEAELKDAIERLATDGSLRRRMGALARSAYEERYTAARHLDSYLATVEAIAAQKAGA